MDVLTPEQEKVYERYYGHIIDLPITKGNSTQFDMLAPCEECPPKTSNVENPELYAVHPYRRLQYGSTDIYLAINSFRNMRFTSDNGWNQNVMDAAMLGLTADAKELILKRAALSPDKDSGRFPVFMPHLQDYQPSSNHLAVMNNALLYMIVLQIDATSVYLLPSWPCEWDVSFKVHAPMRTIIEGQVKSGILTYVAKAANGSNDPTATVIPVNCVAQTSIY
jgi:hypothetical protein